MVAVTALTSGGQGAAIKPSFAIVFYEDGKTKNVICATRHRISSENNSLSIGTIVSPAQITKAFSNLNMGKSEKTISCIPENVIYDSDELLVWYKPRFTGDMWFRHGTKPQRLVVEWPPLLFAVSKINNKSVMQIFALGKNSRPNEKSVLYHAPLMNVNNKGQLCQGTALLPQNISVHVINECESTLIDSQFTHVNHEKTFRHKTNNNTHFSFWKSKSKTNTTEPVRLTVKELALTGQTLQEFIREKLIG